MEPLNTGTEAVFVAIVGPAGRARTALGRAAANALAVPLLELGPELNPGLDPTGAVLLAPDDFMTLAPQARSSLLGLPPAQALHYVELVGAEAVTPLQGAPLPQPVVPLEADLETDQQLTRLLVALGRRTPLDPSNPLFGKEFDAILFDLDGSLIDSTASVIRSWRRFAAEMGVSMQALHENHGQPARVLIDKVLPRGRAAEALARITELEVADAVTVRPTIGAVRLYGSLDDSRRAIVTSGSRAIASARLSAAGIEPPTVMVTSDDVTRGKPDPEPFRQAADRLGVAAGACLVVEDAAAGVRSARAAGCEVLAVTGTSSPEELGEADLIVDGLDRVEVAGSGGRLRLRPVEV